MSWIQPEALPMLIVAPLAGLLLWALDRRRTRRLARIAGPRVSTLASGFGTGHRRTLLFSAALLLALVAVLQPAWGAATRTVEQRGVDIVACLDVSRSMLAQDLQPSRLARAKRALAALAERAHGDRLGLVVFAGEARHVVPLTRDRHSFVELAEAAGPLSVARGGSDLGAALRGALDALEGRSGEHEVILLLTDGEDHEGHALRVAQTCKERGITVHCAGFGTPLGGKIPDAGAFLRDRAGREVVSTLDPTTLRRIAEATGGDYVDAEQPSPLIEVYERRILPMARKAFEAEERRSKENRYQWPLLAAFLFWMVDLCLSDRRRR